MNLRVILADDHPFVRLGVRCALGADGIDVVGEASSPGELLALLGAMPCDVVVTSLAMLDGAGDGPECRGFVERLRSGWPSLPVVVLTVETEASLLSAALSTGIAGMLRKSDVAGALTTVVRDACRGCVSVSAQILCDLETAGVSVRQLCLLGHGAFRQTIHDCVVVTRCPDDETGASTRLAHDVLADADAASGSPVSSFAERRRVR
ncbi:response regulator [Paraburkholderia caballeronis]|uniref:response regulator n=1 Tax=Paraburkholderia caballeronis TaxID=416943 RepID=UPI001064CD6A|nr:response regulator transcription factor [Paraburkholderia caballeronis]TDV18391.1 response regulator receiver domain-containing protein [Paraburkholderia caballeronis]TDV20071.1 response regulator receiver domain-containing protein [Paraburkholderia caballeronis]TDV28288.1 response regulator receiver domain-containing protein [Paraburkholderia caballeronis]